MNVILISFDIIPLFIRALIGDSLNILSWHFDEGNITVFHQVLTSFFILMKSPMKRQTELQLAHKYHIIIASFFKEDYEEVALGRVPYKPTCFHYVDGTFVI